jgi:hypothetical protein
MVRIKGLGNLNLKGSGEKIKGNFYNILVTSTVMAYRAEHWL